MGLGFGDSTSWESAAPLTGCLLSCSGIAGLFSKHGIHSDRVFCIGEQPTQFNVCVGLSDFHLKRTHVIRSCPNVWYPCSSEWDWIQTTLPRMRLCDLSHHLHWASLSWRFVSISSCFTLEADNIDPHKTECLPAPGTGCDGIMLYSWTNSNHSQNNTAVWSPGRWGWEWIRHIL